jgi:hypothetical protein
MYEIFANGYSQESPEVQIFLETLENINPDLSKEEIDRTLKYALIDALPGEVILEPSGELLVKGDIDQPSHLFYKLNKAIEQYYGVKYPDARFSPMLMFGRMRRRGNATAMYTSLEFRDSYFDSNVAPKNKTYLKESVIPEVINKVDKTYAQMQIAFEENIPIKDPTEQDSRRLKSDTPFYSIPNFADQIQHLINSFAEAGIKINVKLDRELPVKGRVTNVDSTSVNITLNPSLMTEDTHIHEFSHIFIDLLGVENPLVKEALKLVEGTTLYNEVAEAYPELEGIALAKEVLVTAMGIEGAKVVSKVKGPIQTAINKIIRALKSLFGINDDAVTVLVQKLLSKRLNPTEFKGQLTKEDQNSKKLDNRVKDFKDLIEYTSIILQDRLTVLENMPVKNDNVIVELKAQINKVKNIKQVEDFIDFVQYMDKVTKLTEEGLEEVFKKYGSSERENLTEQERSDVMQELFIIGNNIKDFFGTTNTETSVMRRLKDSILDREEMLSNKGRSTDKVTALEEKVVKLITRMEKAQKKYYEAGLAFQADLLFEYHTPEINDTIETLVKNIETNKRLISIRKDDKYEAIIAKYGDKKLTKEEEAEKLDELITLNVEQLRNKRISRESLLEELREAQTDKSAFSYMLDPVVYSSQVSLQLFATHLKNKLYQANADTRDLIDRIAPAYREYEKYKGADLNPRSFNEDILETHTYYVPDQKTGRLRPMEMLSFVQPYDITKYHNAEFEAIKKLKETYQRPDRTKEPEKYVEWSKSDAATQYFQKVAQWYNKNTVVTEEGIKMVEGLKNRREVINATLNTYRKSPEIYADKITLYEAQIEDINIQIGRLYDKRNDQYKGVAVRPNDSYRNPKYDKLMSNEPTKKYYQALLDVYKDSQSLVGKQTPTKNSWDQFAYVLPSIESEGLQKVQQDKFNVFKSAKDFAGREFSFLSTDDSYGAVINANKEQRNKVVPVFYVNPTDAKYVSHDVGTTIVLFGGMANMYKRKSEILGSVIMMRDILERREVLNVNASGNPIANATAKAFGFKRKDRSKDISNNFKHLSEFIDQHFFGEHQIKKEFNILGKTLSANKLSSKLTSYTAFNALAANALQAVNQFTIDNEKLAEEAIAGQFFNGKNIAWGKTTYAKEMLSGGIKEAKKFNTDNKLLRFSQEFDLLNDELKGKEKLTGARALKYISLDTAFIMQQVIEHETAITRGLALADAYRGKLKDKDGNVIKNAEGKDANLYDVYVKNETTGKWEIDSKVANFKKIQFINKVSGLYKKTNQVKSSFDSPTLNRRWYGSPLTLFRNYFMPGLRKRFGYGKGVHVDTETGTLNEGMYTSFFRYLKEVYKSRFKFGAVYKMMDDNLEKPNIKRTAAELSFMLASFVIGSMLMAAADDDEDDYAINFAAYQARRLQAELGQFWNPMEFLKYVSSPTAVTSPIINSSALLMHLIGEEVPYLLWGEDEGMFYEKSGPGYEKGERKSIRKFEKLFPIINGIEKSKTPEQAIKWFDLPAR